MENYQYVVKRTDLTGNGGVGKDLEGFGIYGFAIVVEK